VHRALHVLLLSFLLLGMQQQQAVHALTHLGTNHGQGATTAHEAGACVTCELLASGANGVPASQPPAAAASDDPGSPAVAFVTRAVAPAAGYSPRAPPDFS
jgi:hypothetical protein